MVNVKEIIDLISGGLSKKDEEQIQKAADFAEKAHEGQKRANGDPYFVHVFETAKILAKIGMDAKTIIAGLLHDTLEDTKTTEKNLKEKFSEDILFLVKGVTKLGTLRYQGRERHVESLRKFFVAMANDLRVVIVKLADRLHNLRTLQYIQEDKRKRIALESIEVYAALANRLGMGKLKGEIEDAAFPFAYPKEYMQTEEIIKEKKEYYQKELKEVNEELEDVLKKNKIKVDEINYRVKHKYSLWRKLQRYDMDIDKIYDIVALRVVVENISDCYKVLGLIHSVWRPFPNKIKDYIAVPKPNGYQSIHTTVFTGSGGIVEIQIRTKEMHAEAAYGIAAHFSYKESGKGKIDKSKIEWIEGLKNLKNIEKDPKGFLENLKLDFFNHRIFIFTPKGDVVDLPVDSTPVDFAYMIHSDIGNHAIGAKVSGKMASLNTKLQNGDIVEIITKKDAHPSGKWLNFVKTTTAKKNIKYYIDKNSLLFRLMGFGKN
ncbi:MAG: RelA/SpoT family protein [Patescibacteria group bacterium]